MAFVLRLACLLPVVVGLALAAPPLNGPLTAPEVCGREMVELHGVWMTSQVYVPLFADLDLVAYLAALGKEAAGRTGQAPVVLPVYSPNPLHFRRGRVVFVSTGLILEARSEQSLLSTIATDMPRVASTLSGPATRPPPACSAASVSGRARLADVQAPLAAQVREYEDRSNRRLKRR